MQQIDLMFQTMFAELGQRCLDAAFVSDYALDGRFVPVKVKQRTYWYYDFPREGGKGRKYVGPADDPEINARVENFRALKSEAQARRKLVTTLTRSAGLPAPDAFTGQVVEALAHAGLFRLRAVLVGTLAYQCYVGVLGMRLPASYMMTGDADFAQFHSIATYVNDSLPPLLDTLVSIDPSFRPIPHLADGEAATRYVNDRRYEIEFLTPNTGSDDYTGRATPMATLGGAAATPLRFLDYLIHDPVRAVILHGSGISVLVPAPERYAIHKLIVSSRRRMDENGTTKRNKDIQQAGTLVEALAQLNRQVDIAIAFKEAWDRGPHWQEGLAIGRSYLTQKRQDLLEESLRKGFATLGDVPDKYRSV